MITLAERSKMIRNTFGLNTQQDLADILHCSVGKIKAYEQGTTKKFKPSDMLVLKEKFNISMDWLEKGEGEMIVNKSNSLLADIEDVEFALTNDMTDDAKEIISLLPFTPPMEVSDFIKKQRDFKNRYEELSKK